jgi:hypothetical protein
VISSKAMYIKPIWWQMAKIDNRKIYCWTWSRMQPGWLAQSTQEVEARLLPDDDFTSIIWMYLETDATSFKYGKTWYIIIRSISISKLISVWRQCVVWYGANLINIIHQFRLISIYALFFTNWRKINLKNFEAIRFIRWLFMQSLYYLRLKWFAVM